MNQPERIRLTTLSHGAGCACKIGPADLARVVQKIPRFRDPNVLVDERTSDDAAVYRLPGGVTIVQTVDFFTPIVDDPYQFGQVAATNALSDIYAMGARPLFALNIVGFPTRDLPFEILSDILRGGADKAHEAGIPIIGGHSIDDREPKYGLVVTGMLEPGDAPLTNAGARPGDRIVLTKPLGSGILSTALKRGRIDEDRMGPAISVMTHLNAGAARAARTAGVKAATDVTGFGLMGHLKEMVAASGISALVVASQVPVLPGVRDLALEGVIPGGTERNLQAIAPFVTFDASLTAAERTVLADAQTSGGLLLAVSPGSLDRLLDELRKAGTPAAAVIGEFVTGEPGTIRVIP